MNPIKATMLIENTAGAIVLRHINLVKCIPDEKDSSKVILHYKMKGASKTKGWRISKKETQLVFAKGWQAIEGMQKCERYSNTWGYDNFISFESERFKNAMLKLNNILYAHTDELEISEINT